MSYREPPTSWPRRCRPRQRGGGCIVSAVLARCPLPPVAKVAASGALLAASPHGGQDAGRRVCTAHCGLRRRESVEVAGGLARGLGHPPAAGLRTSAAEGAEAAQLHPAGGPRRGAPPQGGHRSAQQSRSLRPRVARKKFSGLLIADLGRSTVMLLSPAPACPSHDSIRNLELGSSWGRSRVDLGLIWVDLG